MFQLHKSDLQTFARDGVVCLRNVLDPVEVAHIEWAIEDAVGAIGKTATGYDLTAIADSIWRNGATLIEAAEANQYDLSALATYVRGNAAEPLRDDRPASSGHFLLDTGVWTRSADMRAVTQASLLPGIAGKLLGAREIRFYDDQVFVKEPGTIERTAFHQDLGYFHIEGDQGCVMWVPIDRATRETGSLGYVRGSHRWGREFKPNMFSTRLAFPGTLGEDLPDIDNNEDKYDIVYFDVNPGDVVIHHFRTIHGSHGNASTSLTRRAASLRYVGEQVRYRQRPGIAAQPHRPLDWADGTALCDPLFPLVWRRDQSAVAAE